LSDQYDPAKGGSVGQKDVGDQRAVEREDDVVAGELLLEEGGEGRAAEPVGVNDLFGGSAQPAQADEEPQRQQVRPLFAELLLEELQDPVVDRLYVQVEFSGTCTHGSCSLSRR
jgi:hypothetical protein